jgi:hypothetical protein
MANLMSSRSFLMLLRVFMSSVRSSPLPLRELGWLESREEEEDLRRGEGGEVAGKGRGGGVAERRDIEGERGEVAHN